MKGQQQQSISTGSFPLDVVEAAAAAASFTWEAAQPPGVGAIKPCGGREDRALVSAACV